MRSQPKPRRLLMTVDAVGGVWRYAMDLAQSLRIHGVETIFTGFGPLPTRQMLDEAAAIGDLHWSGAPLDWMANDEGELAMVSKDLLALADASAADLLHLNLPSQAADLSTDLPVVVVAHSCVVTWFAAVRGTAPPAGWHWHGNLNRRGLAAADAIIAPSQSHAAALARSFGVHDVDVVHNASRHVPVRSEKKRYCFAAGRWWDEGKNAAVLDRVAALANYPIVAAGPSEGPNGQRVALEHLDYRGPLSHRETMALMDEAALFVSPSVYEPFGLAALEAARAGAALVLSDIPTYRELWHEAALFAAPGDPRAFADAIERLAADHRLRRDLALTAQAHSRQFSVENQASAMVAVYERLLGQRHDIRAAE